MKYGKLSQKYVLAFNPVKYEELKTFCEKKKIQMSDWIRLAIDKEYSFQTAKGSK